MSAPFERVVAEHGAAVLRVVVGDSDADDAWSETFLAAMRAYPELPDGANVEAWLVTIAHRKAVDIVRARARRAVPVAEPAERASTIGNPDAEGRELWAAVGALPPKQRQAIAYHYLAGLPYDAIAELIGGSADAARRAAADGMTRLRRDYACEGATP